MDRSGDRQSGAGRAQELRLRSGSFVVATVLMALAAGAFFALPLLGIFLQGDLSHGIHSSVGQTALRVSLVTSGISLALMLIVGTPVAYWIGPIAMKCRQPWDSHDR